jgi:hypothetical protein
MQIHVSFFLGITDICKIKFVRIRELSIIGIDRQGTRPGGALGGSSFRDDSRPEIVEVQG